jgi:hypothetical protein
MENPYEMWGNTFVPIDVCLGELPEVLLPADILAKPWLTRGELIIDGVTNEVENGVDEVENGVDEVENIVTNGVENDVVEVEESKDPVIEDTILSLNELEMYKTEAILARDRLVSIINDISSYRVLNHQYLPITRDFIREIEARDFADIERYKSLPNSFAFVMALHNKECRKMADDEILSNFFGENWASWINAPESVPDLPEERREQIYANYEYMAYVVLNVCDELAFNIKTM